MRRNIILAAVLAVAVLWGTVLIRQRHSERNPGQATTPAVAEAEPSPSIAAPVQPLATRPASAPAGTQSAPARPSSAPPAAAAPATKSDRLAQIRESFRALAAGDPTTALRAARQLAGNERETALLALVTEWTRGELTPPQQRAWAISNYGLEAGLGLELARNPQLAVSWANELTDGKGSALVLGHAAVGLLDSQPAAAFALGNNLAADDRKRFMDSVFGGWAQKDTEAALRWADQLDAAEREAAVKAIQSEAPVGIGAVLRVQDGYPVIQQILPGAPAEGGQIQPGDRIVALAQGDNAFVDARGLPLKQVVDAIRGPPGTVLQLQVLSADARPDSAPRIVSVMRGQIKFKEVPKPILLREE